MTTATENEFRYRIQTYTERDGWMDTNLGSDIYLDALNIHLRRAIDGDVTQARIIFGGQIVISKRA